MTGFRTIPCLPALAALALGLLAAGCATPDVNPARARAGTGYVDLHTGSADDLGWDVARFDNDSHGFRRLFSDLKPVEGGILRLALAPGRHRLRVTFLNRVIAQPAEIEMEIQDGKVTPVLVTLTEAGTTQVRTRETRAGGTAYGRYGRRTRIGSDESVLYRLTAAPQPAAAYQPKEHMSYAR